MATAQDETQVPEWQRQLEGKDPQEVLAWGFQEFGDKVVMACSFGGITGMAMLDMAAKVNPGVRVFYTDTDFLFSETHELIETVKHRYGINPVGYKSRWTPEQQAKEFGEALWSKDPDRCCWLRKVEPTGRALEGNRAWISGLRRDQGSTRAATPLVEWDSKYEVVKLNPMALWASKQVKEYIAANNVPVNALHARGYPSIGCTHCTRPVKAGEDERAGRWTGFNKTECGIHVPDAKVEAAGAKKEQNTPR
ncbi:MAG: phosphoadenylyl-sulfate reductase [Dehalococcoidia bacterium]|nr:phosphoadenylyl-sulfate reductase [Dehalococcoidia bacterium]